MSLLPGARFADRRVWLIDCNEYGEQFYDVYHVLKVTTASVLVHRATLFKGCLAKEGNAKLDSIISARANGKTEFLNNPTRPERFMLRTEGDNLYFKVGKGTATQFVRLDKVIYF